MAKTKQSTLKLKSDMFDEELSGSEFVGKIYERAMALRDRKSVDGKMVESEPSYEARFNAYLLNLSNKMNKLKRMLASNSLSRENFQEYVKDMMSAHLGIISTVDFIPQSLLPKA